MESLKNHPNRRMGVMSNKELFLHKIFLVSIFLGVLPAAIQAMVFDNRFVPLYERFNPNPDGFRSRVWASGLLAFARSAVDDNEHSVPIPEICGRLDLSILGVALEKVGLNNPLPSELQSTSIEWRTHGIFNAEGAAVAIDQVFGNCYSVGGSIVFMRTNMRHEFFLRRSDKEDEQLVLLSDPEKDRIRRLMFDELCIQPHSDQAGIGDFTLYAGITRCWYKVPKFRRVDADARVGLLIPSGVSTQLDKLNSIPFGGNGHWGAYTQANLLMEVKEDIKLGFRGYISKRFKKNKCRRVPVNGEPPIFGALITNVGINPGVTLSASLFASIENIRQGLGFSVAYTFAHHWQDRWTDRRSDDEQAKLPVCFDKVEECSAWGSDYLTLGAFYEFWDPSMTSWCPMLTGSWDVPVSVFASRRMMKTHAIWLGVQMSF